MKKFLPLLFIVLVIVNIFAPLSVSTSRKTLSVSVSKAEATGIILNATTQKTDTQITTDVQVVWTNGTSFRGNEGVVVEIQRASSGQVLGMHDVPLETVKEQGAEVTQKGSFTLTGLLPDTEYKVTTRAFQTRKSWTSIVAANITLGLSVLLTDPDISDSGVPSPEYIIVKTNPAGQTTATTGASQASVNGDALIPSCGINDSWITGGGTLGGCIGQIFYYVLFVPTSYLFALAGQFFDWAFSYSVGDAAYRSPFVVEGWGLVRDFCNIFFIFVLLYIAFSTILNIHGFSTKTMVMNVVIIGLLINFSLFAAQVIIDTSNILARVFYNSDSIKITKGGKDGTNISAVGDDGVIPLSAAIVNKVNPQNLIINGSRSVKVQDKVSGVEATAQDSKTSAIGVGAFILITLLATAVNVVGLIVFLSVGMIFIARVIGLWIAMIVVPLTFFTYMVPSMKSIGMIGWSKWWPETLKLAFLAPIFIFFIYLILKFLDTGLDLIHTSGQTGTAFVISIIVPFAFIMVLLMKAKDIAKDLSGSLGQSITGGVAAIGGLALGGAALGGALLGRNIIGKGMAAVSRTDDAKHFGNEKVKYNKTLETWKANGRVGAKPTWEQHVAANNQNPNNKKIQTSLITRLGGNLNAQQAKVGEVDHARHEMDSIKEKAGLKGVDDSRLSGVDKENIKKTFTREKRSEIESEIKKGSNSKGPVNLVDANGQPVRDGNGNVITGGESGFKAANRQFMSRTVGNDPNAIANGDVDPQSLGLTDAGKKKVEDQLNVAFNAVLQTTLDKESESRLKHLEEESKQKVGAGERLFSQSNKGSYDVRNLSQTKTDKREGFFTKSSAALIAGIATGVRTGLKNANINHGSGQGDFLKDLGHTLTEAMKSAKVTVKVEESHGSSGHDDHGGGHGGGHH